MEPVAKFFSLEIDEAILILLTITHPTIEPLRLVNNDPRPDGSTDIVSRGETYLAYPFEPELPTDNDEQPVARLRIANVDRRIAESLMHLTSPPELAFEIIRSVEPDVVLRRFARFELRNVTWDAIEVTGELMQASFAAEPWPNIRVVPSLFPALFR